MLTTRLIFERKYERLCPGWTVRSRRGDIAHVHRDNFRNRKTADVGRKAVSGRWGIGEQKLKKAAWWTVRSIGVDIAYVYKDNFRNRTTANVSREAV